MCLALAFISYQDSALSVLSVGAATPQTFLIHSELLCGSLIVFTVTGVNEPDYSSSKLGHLYDFPEESTDVFSFFFNPWNVFR